MNKAVTDVITSYKPRNINALRDQQSALTPSLDPYIVEGQVFEYTYDTQRALVDVNKEACFRMHYTYLKSMAPRKYIYYSICKEPIDYLVAEEVIDPFLMFINKKLVPWSMMTIVMTHEEYYILCKTADPTWINEFKNVSAIDVIHLPSGCVYTDFPVGEADNKVFGFTNDGYFSDDPDCPISIINESPFMKFDSYVTNGAINAYAVSNNTNIKFFPNNVICLEMVC